MGQETLNDDVLRWRHLKKLLNEMPDDLLDLPVMGESDDGWEEMVYSGCKFHSHMGQGDGLDHGQLILTFSQGVGIADVDEIPLDIKEGE